MIMSNVNFQIGYPTILMINSMPLDKFKQERRTSDFHYEFSLMG